jgi:hypothetical protein
MIIFGLGETHIRMCNKKRRVARAFCSKLTLPLLHRTLIGQIFFAQNVKREYFDYFSELPIVIFFHVY